MSQDDGGALNRKHNDNASEPIMPKRSFERSDSLAKYWKYSGAPPDIEVSGGQNGDNWLSWTPNSAFDFIYQRATYTEADSRAVDVEAFIRKTTSLTTSGDVTIEMWRQIIDYEDAPPCSGLFPDGKDADDRDVAEGGAWAKMTSASAHCSPSTSWQACTGTDFEIQQNGNDGWDLEIRVYSDVNFASDFIEVGLDKVAIRDDT